MRYALVVVALLLAAPGFAQHAGLRQQWQPQTESDPRLQQPVEMEILGRAAVTGLPLLAEKTGVSLSVAPEDLATVGERKLTVIAKGCTLKAIMVQLAEALQECHWDVDVSGEQRAYLLHRNAGAGFTMMELEQAAEARQLEKYRVPREARLEDARRALAMTPEELAELEKTDPVLARSVRDPLTRTLMKALFTISPEQVQSWRQGGMAFTYADAPEPVRKAAEAVVSAMAGWLEKNPAVAADMYQRHAGAGAQGMSAEAAAMEAVKSWREKGSRVIVRFSDEGCDLGFGVRCLVDIPMGDGVVGWSEAALPPRYISTDEGSGSFLRMLQATGSPDHDTAWKIITDNERDGFRTSAEKLEARRRQEWVEPADAELHRPITIGDREFKSLTEFQQFAAQQTGLSIIADYFTKRPSYIPDELRAETPLWRLLYAFSEDSFGNPIYRWQKAGSCLVFTDGQWYQRAKSEVPESLLQAYAAKYQAQGELTLDDLAAFAVALGDRSPSYDAIPEELRPSGLSTVGYARWALTLYASLSPDQVAQARSAAGLPYDDMTIAQRQQMAEAATKTTPPVLPGDVSQSALRITESTRTRGEGENATTFLTTRFTVAFPGAKYEQAVTQRKAGESGAMSNKDERG
jgi:hypothetical protein